MTVKEFFKSKSFKCIIVLLCVLLLSGAILTIAYGFLAVSAGEKLQRAISNIYSGESVTVYGAGDKEIDDSDPQGLVEETVSLGDAQILQAYKIKFDGKDDVNYLVSSKGLHGYGEGTVTCWVAVDVDEAAKKVTGVEKVTISANTNQSFISKVGDATLSYFEGDVKSDGYSVTDDGFITGGATKSSTAICNAVNGAISYVNTVIFGNDETDAYADFEYTGYIETAKTEVGYAASSSSDAEYKIVTKSYGAASAFKITVVVGSDKKIKSYTITENGSTNGYESKMPSSVSDGSAFIGKDISYFTGIYGEDMAYTGVTAELTTGASTGVSSNSVYLCMYAGAFATANYDAAILAAGGAN